MHNECIYVMIMPSQERKCSFMSAVAIIAESVVAGVMGTVALSAGLSLFLAKLARASGPESFLSRFDYVFPLLLWTGPVFAQLLWNWLL